MGFPTKIARENFPERIKEFVDYIGGLIPFDVTNYNNAIEQWSKHLHNVGITRAISSLYVVWDHQYCIDIERKFGKNVLSDLAKYSNHLSKVIDS